MVMLRYILRAHSKHHPNETTRDSITIKLDIELIDEYRELSYKRG